MNNEGNPENDSWLREIRLNELCQSLTTYLGWDPVEVRGYRPFTLTYDNPDYTGSYSTIELYFKRKLILLKQKFSNM